MAGPATYLTYRQLSALVVYRGALPRRLQHLSQLATQPGGIPRYWNEIMIRGSPDHVRSGPEPREAWRLGWRPLLRS